MDTNLDVKLLVKHLANGSFGENMCRVCLRPLTDICENIFTTICKEEKEYRIADILKEICDIQILDGDHYNVCPTCFTAASNAYKFYLNAKAHDEMLNYYTEELIKHVNSVDVDDNIKAESICISLPVVSMECFDYDFKDIGASEKVVQEDANEETINEKISKPVSKSKVKNDQEDDEEIVIVMDEKGQPRFFKLLPDGTLVKKEYDQKCQKAYDSLPKKEKKIRRKRAPMTAKKCPRCPIKYRFLAKLKEHMRTEHAVVLYACKICEALTEDVDEYTFHMKTHTTNYECDICHVVFKKRETMLDHIKEHNQIDDPSQSNLTKSDFVCKLCGSIFPDEDSLTTHTDLNHYKKYACFYCGRTYKGVISFEKHVKKHEMYLKPENKRKAPAGGAPALTCELCGRGFRGERALMWHSRLHTNERPFTCDVCGRGFVSLNRRNQHALCAHTVPARRCPLCPALFHLRSMINTHIKKVHLKRHKRRARASRQQDVFWRTEPVPVQELSVALQGRVLELQAGDRARADAQ